MTKFKLSAVSMALIAGGLAVGSAESFANVACTSEISLTKQDGVLSECSIVESKKIYVKDENIIYSGGKIITLDESNFTIDQSSIKYSSGAGGFYDYLVSANKSNLKIINSSLEVYAYNVPIIQLKDSNADIINGIFKTNSNSNIFSIKNSTLNIENSTLNGTSYGDSKFLIISDSNTVNLNHSNVSVDYGIYSDYDDSRKNLTINLNNSSLKASEVLTPFGGTNAEDSIKLKAVQSELFGKTKLIEKDIKIDFNLTDSEWRIPRSTWRDVEENQITNLILNNSVINLSNPINESSGKQSSQIFTILGNLSGSGDFALNTDLANQQSDKIVVKGKDSGEFGLKINDSGNEPQSANGKVTLVETQTGTAKFALKENDYVDAGAYRYRLFKEGMNWVLSNKDGEKNTPTAPKQSATTENAKQPSKPTAIAEVKQPQQQPTTQTASTTPANNNVVAGAMTGATVVVKNTAGKVIPPVSQPTSHQVVLSEKSNALVSLRQAQLVQLENNLAGIHQRLGELKNGGKGNVWVRNVNGRNEFASTTTDSNSRSSGFTQNQHTLQLGADTAVSDNVRLGGFVGTSRSNVDFNGEYGSGKVKSQAVGLYGTLLSDSGLYWDNLAKYEWLTAESASTGKRRYHAYTLSSEVGKIFSFGNEWKLTPNAQLTWTNLSGRGDEQRISAVSSRLGLRFAKGFNLANGWNLQPYAEVNAINSQTNRNAVSVNQYRFEVEESGSRVETVLGLTAGNGNHRFGLEAKNSNGKRLDQPFALQANYRYSW